MSPDQLLRMYETGHIDRRGFLQALAAVGTAAAATAQAAPAGILQISRVNHFEIKSTNIARTRDFYQKLFGLDAKTTPGRAFVLLPGGVHISIGEVPPAEASALTNHYAFGIVGFDSKNPKPTVDRITAAGFEVIPSQAGLAQPFVRDPDGRRVQITEAEAKP